MLGTLPAGGVPSDTTLGGITWAEANARMAAFDAAMDDEAKLRDLGVDQVIFWRDLSGLTGAGVHTVPVTIRIEGYENIGIKGSYQMVVDLKVASDTPTEP